jgi:hypothetical protein
MEIKKSAYAQGYSERIDSFAPARFDLSACPSMSLAAPRLHSRAGGLAKRHTAVCISAAPAAFDRHPRDFTGHVARPARSIRQSFGVTGP